MARVILEDGNFKPGQQVLVKNCSAEDWHLAVFSMKVLDEHGETVYIVNEEGKDTCVGWKMCRLFDQPLKVGSNR